MPNTSVPITAGTGTNIDTFTMPNGDHRQTFLKMDHGGYQGKSPTFRIAGRAAGTRQTFLTIWNPVGTAIDVNITGVNADSIETAIKAATVIRPILRLYKISAAPTGGVALAKTTLDSSQTANANVTLLQDASADGTNAATALAFTTAIGIVSQEFAPQLITAAGYEPADRAEFLVDDSLTLKPGEGAALCIEYPAIASNPTTDFWIASIRWEEYVA